ncbi:hypothetical protein HDV00_010718 [Rhizophlyctis rosea]|nr:hypothetical protein HDV00_010718 [Rhizophlyctis rosea]
MSQLEPLFEILPQDVIIDILTLLTNPTPTLRTCKNLRALTNNETLRAEYIHNIHDPLLFRTPKRKWVYGWHPKEFDQSLLCPNFVLQLMVKVKGVEKCKEVGIMSPAGRLLMKAPWWDPEPGQLESDDDRDVAHVGYFDNIPTAIMATTPSEEVTAQVATTAITTTAISIPHICTTNPAEVATFIYTYFVITDHHAFQNLLHHAPEPLLSTIAYSMTISTPPFPHDKQRIRWVDVFPTLLARIITLSDNLDVFRHILRHQPYTQTPGPERIDASMAGKCVRAGLLGRARIVEFILSNPHTEPEVKALTFLGVLMGGHMEIVRRCGNKEDGDRGYELKKGDLEPQEVGEHAAKVIERAPQAAFEYLVGRAGFSEWMGETSYVLEWMRWDEDGFDDEVGY